MGTVSPGFELWCQLVASVQHPGQRCLGSRRPLLKGTLLENVITVITDLVGVIPQAPPATALCSPLKPGRQPSRRTARIFTGHAGSWDRTSHCSMGGTWKCPP